MSSLLTPFPYGRKVPTIVHYGSTQTWSQVLVDLSLWIKTEKNDRIQYNILSITYVSIVDHASSLAGAPHPATIATHPSLVPPQPSPVLMDIGFTCSNRHPPLCWFMQKGSNFSSGIFNLCAIANTLGHFCKSEVLASVQLR